jgi:hypothetical protein
VQETESIFFFYSIFIYLFIGYNFVYYHVSNPYVYIIIMFEL